MLIEKHNSDGITFLSKPISCLKLEESKRDLFTGIIKVSSYNAKSESNTGLSCMKGCMKRKKLWNHSHANNTARSDYLFFFPKLYTFSWRSLKKLLEILLACYGSKKSNKGDKKKKPYGITETDMQEHLKGIHVDRLTDIVLQAYRAVKLNWLFRTTASNPNAYVCKWDVMVPTWCTCWAD